MIMYMMHLLFRLVFKLKVWVTMKWNFVSRDATNWQFTWTPVIPSAATKLNIYKKIVVSNGAEERESPRRYSF